MSECIRKNYGKINCKKINCKYKKNHLRHKNKVQKITNYTWGFRGVKPLTRCVLCKRKTANLWNKWAVFLFVLQNAYLAKNIFMCNTFCVINVCHLGLKMEGE